MFLLRLLTKNDERPNLLRREAPVVILGQTLSRSSGNLQRIYRQYGSLAPNGVLDQYTIKIEFRQSQQYHSIQGR